MNWPTPMTAKIIQRELPPAEPISLGEARVRVEGEDEEGGAVDGAVEDDEGLQRGVGDGAEQEAEDVDGLGVAVDHDGLGEAGVRASSGACCRRCAGRRRRCRGSPGRRCRSGSAETTTAKAFGT